MNPIVRLAAWVADRTFGRDRAEALIGDLQEDLARHRRALPSFWLLRQVCQHAVAARRADRAIVRTTLHARRRGLEVSALGRDVRHAVRSLVAAPGFTVVALGVLTLGIGASTTIFSIVDAVVLRGLPYDEGDRLVEVTTRDTKTGQYLGYATPQDFADWQARASAFSAITAVTRASGFTVAENGTTEDLDVLRVTAGYFDVYRVRPALGRPITAADEVEGDHFVALISDSLWRRQFGADPQILGRTMQSRQWLAMGAPRPVPAGAWTIVGVMPPDFRSPVTGAHRTDVWVPYVVAPEHRERGRSKSAHLEVIARLAAGASVDEADTNIRTVTAALAADYPDWFATDVGAVRSLYEATVGSVRGWMYLLIGAVGLVLLIACVNVANLTLARGAVRSREIRIRAALGAGRWQIARGLLVESLVLSAVATILGVVIAQWGVAVLRAALPAGLPRLSTVAIDLRVVGVAAAASLGTGLLFGLIPAIHCSRPNLSNALRAAGHGTTAGRAHLRAALVVAQVAVALLLTIGAGLFAASFLRVTRVEIGLDHRGVLTMPVWPRIDSSVPGWATPAAERAALAVPEIVERVAAIPGVIAVGFVGGGLPFSGLQYAATVLVPGREAPPGVRQRLDIRHVTPGYAQAVGARIVRGRHVADSDTSGSEPVVVLTEEAVRRYFADRDALGSSISLNGTMMTVVGVAADVRFRGPESAVRPEAYVPAAQGSFLGGDLAIRTVGDPVVLADRVRDAIRVTLPDISPPEASTLESQLRGLLAQRQFNMLIVGLFGLVALAIAGAGIYGVMAYLVAERTREMGVRLALGARPGRVMALVVGRAVVQIAVGIGAGLSGAWFLASIIESFLFDVATYRPVVYAAAVVLLFACGLVAAYLPARRAARVDPLVALRE